MKKKNNNISLLDVISELEVILNDSENSLQLNDTTKLKEFVIYAKNKIYDLRKYLIILIVMGTFFCIMNIIESYKISNLENDIIEKTNIINKLKYNNETLNRYVLGEGEFKQDSLVSYSPAYNFDTKKTFKYYELKKEYERLYIENLSIKTDKAHIKELNAEIKVNNLEILFLKNELKIINLKYGISFINDRIHAPKVDSALVIFPVFKDRMKYDSKCKCWNIRK